LRERLAQGLGFSRFVAVIRPDSRPYWWRRRRADSQACLTVEGGAVYVRKKVTRSGAVKYDLVEDRSEGGRVWQKVLWYLGPFATPEALLASWEPLIRANRGPGGDAACAARLEGLRDRLRAVLRERSVAPNDEASG
jgi:hypothetical protein